MEGQLNNGSKLPVSGNVPMRCQTRAADPPSRARTGADRHVFHVPVLQRPRAREKDGNARFWATCAERQHSSPT